MKIFPLAANENWVVDRFVKEWCENNADITTHNAHEADVLWLVAGWCWNQVPKQMLENKKVILTVHHIVPEKFDQQQLNLFLFRDQFVDAYHVPCEKTQKQIKNLTSKPIFTIPFWSNPKLWYEINDKASLRKKYELNEEDFIVGSFQRDTEGSDLISPKLEKGPDIFCDKVIEMSKDSNKKVTVLLAGWRRQYVMKRLEEAEIPFKYLELPDFTTINELYNCLDLYMITARHEGGPQSIIECALTNTPCVSTDVGLARLILSDESIFDNSLQGFPTPNIDHASEKVKDLNMPAGFEKFRKMMQATMDSG